MKKDYKIEWCVMCGLRGNDPVPDYEDYIHNELYTIDDSLHWNENPSDNTIYLAGYTGLAPYTSEKFANHPLFVMGTLDRLGDESLGMKAKI